MGQIANPAPLGEAARGRVFKAVTGGLTPRRSPGHFFATNSF